ncbi:MAG: leucine-rich repeat protein [Clostridia bacterium]|nr:leucine-rich repeat protein [Clostridia bacterium]
MLAIAILVQAMSLGISASVYGFAGLLGSSGSLSSPGNSGNANFDSDAVIEALQGDVIKYMKKDLIQRIEDQRLTGSAEVILMFSDKSLVSEYTEKYADKMTYDEFKVSDAAIAFERELKINRETTLRELEESGLVFEVKHTYTHVLDGAFVMTTYENMSDICENEGVSGAMLSQSYLPMKAPNNPVDVYDTGIFNSGSVSYTGKGTIVAVLDTGCDYAHPAFTTYSIKDGRYDRDEIAALLPLLEASKTSVGLEAREVYYGNLTGGKIAFGYDYADKDPDIMPFENSHGTHVAGIIAGKGGEITGVAIDAQLAIMKVFSDYDDGAKDGDIIAALEDCITLGVDAINMSLGTSCGFTEESELDELYKNTLYSNIEKAGISLVVAASNDHSSGFGGENGNTNKTDNPDSATVGSPSTYLSSFTVASVSGTKENFMIANGKDEVFFIKSYSTSAKEYDFFEMMGIKEGDKKVYDYVAVPGFGDRVNYSGVNVKGKIALVSRGDITFEEKVQFAQEAGAIAVLIYNNVYGDITMTIGNHAKIPAVSIGKDEGEMLAALKTGTLEFDLSNKAGPFMSDFSSWGPTPDLKLKPEITAHGGNIKSAVVGGEYDEMSGTSMAAPNMCGITVLIRQYVNEKFPELSVTEARDLVNRLCMSTATIAKDKKDHPYSPRKQGAGLADITKATTTAAYLLVDGIGKTKLELGDDPKRTGVYEMTIKLVNISDSAQSYKLGNLTMTESVSVSDPEYVAELAYMLSNTSEYSVDGGVLSADNVVTVDANKTATIKVKITLSDEDKAYLDSTFENGMFIEGYLTFDNTNEEGVDLNAPFLAFYGNWGDAPIFDIDYYEVETEAHNNAIDDDDKIKADYYATTPLGTYYYDYIIPLGTYLYEMDEDAYSAIPATREHAAVSCVKTSISGIYGVFTGLLRGAKELNVTITNTETGEVVWSMTEYNCAKAHYYGAPRGYMSRIDLPMFNDETGSLFAANNTHFEVTMSAKLDWDGGENKSDTYSFSFYVDYEAPTVVDSQYRVKYDKSRKENRYYLDVMVYDNHYAMSCRPILIYDFTGDFTGDFMGEDDVTTTFSSLSEYPIPIYQQNKGEVTKVEIEITDYIDIIKNSKTPNGITLYIDDYAMNAGVYYIPFPETDSEDLVFNTNSIDLSINQTANLVDYFVHADGSEIEITDYLYTLNWTSSDPSVVAVKDGEIEALGSGTAKIRVTADTWVDYEYVGEDKNGRPEYETKPMYKEITVNVSDTQMKDDPNSGINADIKEIFFTSYDTLFAHNTHINFSEIGRTGSTNYFDGNYSLAFYPAEKIQLHYELDPWNLADERYELKWSSNKPDVASVDGNGVVTGEKEGKAVITLKIVIDGKEEQLIAARLSVEIKSEFIIENRELIAYKGKGGDVVIPDDEGILYIGAYAFSHFYLDNKKVVEKDENGYYDLDDKKTPLGNTTVTSVVIPEGVENIKKYAFYNCTALKEVVLPDSCETIGTAAFQGCKNLEKINFAGDPNVENDKDGVKIISDNAFYDCRKLASSGENGADFAGVYAIGQYAFYNTAFTSLDLSLLSRISMGAFYGCKSLTTLKLGERTRISDSMFYGCTALTDVTIYSDTVGDKAFYGCTALKNVTLANNVTYLGVEAFKNCSKLGAININAEIEYIGKNAFAGCTSLESFKLPEDAQLTNYKIEGGAIYTKNGDTLVLVLPSNITSFEVPASVKYISGGAFVTLKNLQIVSFASGSAIEVIGDGAFAGLKSLKTVNLPANKEIKIGIRAFDEATSLRTIDLTSVIEIGDYAFNKTAITALTLNKEKIKIGSYAFKDTKSLGTVVLTNGVKIGVGAFENSAVTTVDLKGGNATVGDSAFKNCVNLTSFDFSGIKEEKDANGNVVEIKIGDYAFFGCKKLKQVVANDIYVIGNSVFAGCVMLEKLEANKLESIGNGAFFDVTIDISKLSNDYTATRLTKLDLPKLEKIGDSAFSCSVGIASANLPALKEIGEMSFYMAMGLKTITASADLKVIPAMAFVGCQFDISWFSDEDKNGYWTNEFLSNIESIGPRAFYYSNIPANIEFEKLTYLDKQSFAELGIISFRAPKLEYIGDEAFAVCSKLESIYAPAVKHIGDGAFTQTLVTEFEVSDALESIGNNPFFMADKFEGFFATESGTRTTTKTFTNAKIVDGALYVKNARGYSLVSYPMTKTDIELVVEEGTTRIELYAVSMNENLLMVKLPASLRSIADFAFIGTNNLNTVTFRSYYAPTLESMMSIANVDKEIQYITVDNLDKFPGFETLYKYSYSIMFDGFGVRNLYQNNFKAGVGGFNAPKMTAIIPENCVGYDALVYKAYFDVSETEKSGINSGRYAVAFTDAVHALPDSVDRFDKLLVETAINAYNALEAHSDEKVFVDASVVEKFERLRVQYNVNVVDGKIAALFGMYNTEYHFNILKDATLAYNALTDDEKALVANADVLSVKYDELCEAMGVEVNFDITYAEHFKSVEPDDPIISDDEKEIPWKLIIIIAASVVVVAGIGVVLIVIIKKKKASVKVTNSVNAPVNEESDATPANENDTIENSDAKEE